MLFRGPASQIRADRGCHVWTLLCVLGRAMVRGAGVLVDFRKYSLHTNLSEGLLLLPKTSKRAWDLLGSLLRDRIKFTSAVLLRVVWLRSLLLLASG